MSKQKRGKILLIGAVLALVVAILIPACTEPTLTGKEPSRLTISGGSIGGTSNIAASAYAGVAHKFLGIDTTVIIHVPEAAPEMLHERNCDLSIVTPPVPYDAYTGTGSYKGQTPMTELRTLMLREATTLDIVVPLNSPAKSFKDLIGKRVATGKKGMLAANFFEELCNNLGVKPSTVDILYLGHEEAGAAMAIGKLDACFVLGPHPHPSWGNTDLISPIRFLPLSAEEQQTLIKSLPYLYIGELPQGLYHHQGRYSSPHNISEALVTNRMSEDVAYKLIKSFIENPDYVGSYRSTLKDAIVSGDVKKFTEDVSFGVPYHAGSVRYFKERGWKIPANRIPPEAK